MSKISRAVSVPHLDSQGGFTVKVVIELESGAAGWGAVRGDYLEGLYTAPEFAGRGMATGLLARLEGLMIERGIQAVRAEASSNAQEFYLRRGYRLSGPQTTAGAWPIAKELQ